MVRLPWPSLGLLAGWATAEANPAEVDLIFPREGTYAPMHSMPVVFAVQNPSAAKELHAVIEHGVRPKGGGYTVWGHSDELATVPANVTTYFSSSSLDTMLNTTGSWEFFWNMYWLNCSRSYDPEYYNTKFPWVLDADGLNLDTVQDGFHLSKYLSRPTLSSSTPKKTGLSGDHCSEASGFVFPAVLNTLDIPRDFPDHRSLPSTCAQIVNSTLTSATDANPCKVSISSVAEARVLADAECHNAVFPGSGCPDKTPEDGIAAGHDHGQAAWTAVTLALALVVGLVRK